MPDAPDTLSADEERELRTLGNAQIVERFRRGVPAAMFLTAMICAIGLATFEYMSTTRRLRSTSSSRR